MFTFICKSSPKSPLLHASCVIYLHRFWLGAIFLMYTHIPAFRHIRFRSVSRFNCMFNLTCHNNGIHEVKFRIINVTTCIRKCRSYVPIWLWKQYVNISVQQGRSKTTQIYFSIKDKVLLSRAISNFITTECIGKLLIINNLAERRANDIRYLNLFLRR